MLSENASKIATDRKKILDSMFDAAEAAETANSFSTAIGDFF